MGDVEEGMGKETGGRGDPVVPLLASAVAAIVLGSIVFVFYPHVADWIASQKAGVSGRRDAAETEVPVWVCRNLEGVALFLEPYPDGSAERVLNEAMPQGPRNYLLLQVFNFAGPEKVSFDFTKEPLRAVDGVVLPQPAADLLRESVPPALIPVLRGLGAVHAIDVARGRSGQALFVVFGDASRHAAYALGDLQFDLRRVALGKLAGFRRSPDLKGFREF